jgi:hypothetical protein
LSLVHLLLPIPASFDRYHRRDHHDAGSLFDAGSSSDDMQQNLRMTVVLLAASPECSAAKCHLQISSSGVRGSKILRFTWSEGGSQENFTIGNQQAVSSSPSRNSSHTQPLISVHRSSSCFTAASTPPFFPVSDTLTLSRFPFNRHVVILPPCAAAQVHRFLH